MRRTSLYLRLARTNIRANYRLYVPYLLASTGMVMMYYIILMLAMDPSLSMQYLSMVLGSGSWVVGLFAVSFILYVSSFLMKQRTREFGLYNVLGMNKRQIGCVVLAETLISYAVSMAGGILLGTALSKLLQLLLLRLIRYGGDIAMQLSLKPAMDTMILFAVIYLLAYLSTLARIWKTRPADLLASANAGEKEPKARWLMAAVGTAALLAGYWLSQYVQSPVDAFVYFFVAVALVMIGTYLLFTAGSIAVLRILQRNPRYYYQKNHFINVSGMMYRMKQNARGLAQICILSCMVLVTVSMTVSLYAGVEGILRQRHQRDLDITAVVSSQAQAEQVRADLLKESGSTVRNEQYFAYSESFLQGSGSSYAYAERVNGAQWNTVLYVYSIEDYCRITGRQVSLASDEILLYSSRPSEISRLAVGGDSWRVKEQLSEYPPLPGSDRYDSASAQIMYAYCPDPYAMTRRIQSNPEAELTLCEQFDSDLTAEQQEALCSRLNAGIFAGTQDGHAGGIAADRADYYLNTGSYLFIGIFLGGIFLIATVLIIYYKQVSEGYEDRHRYDILQQVGLSREEVRRTIHSQVLTVFFLPLAAAMLHIVFAFHMVYELMLAFGLNDVSLFLRCMLATAAVFALIYTAVYIMTSKVYCHIVERPA